MYAHGSTQIGMHSQQNYLVMKTKVTI